MGPLHPHDWPTMGIKGPHGPVERERGSSPFALPTQMAVGPAPTKVGQSGVQPSTTVRGSWIAWLGGWPGVWELRRTKNVALVGWSGRGTVNVPERPD